MPIPFFSRKPLFNEAQQQQIVSAVQTAELRTSGEIRVYVESRCRYVDPLDRAAEVFAGLHMEKTAARNGAPKPPPDMPSAEHGAIALLERSAVVAALRTLPPRQREALVLRYYGNLSEAQIAGAMAISQGAVKSHTARAMIALRAVLEREG